MAIKIKQQLRRVPELKFFLDDTLDNVFRMEELFKEIKKEEPKEDSTDLNNTNNNL